MSTKNLTSRFIREIREAEAAGRPYAWADVMSLSEGDVEELGVEGAMAARNAGSPHRASSGLTTEIVHAHGRKAGKEHYKRKAILEAEKEVERRAKWLRRHPGAPESNWARRQETRKVKRAERVRSRKALKAMKAAAAAAVAERAKYYVPPHKRGTGAK
jgi:hypothetical protein